ncbi:MAG: hypothetical protein K0M55_15820 [Rhizobium sp.]|nr:hypothetical protein [Rhizobium sp.]MBW8319265.1 hypothetical protein [Rhizobium sp.]
MSKTAIDLLVNSANATFAEARVARALAEKYGKEMAEANAKADSLELHARSLLAGADKLEGRG